MSTTGLNIRDMNPGELLKLAGDSMIDIAGKDIDTIRREIAKMYNVDLSVVSNTSPVVNANDKFNLSSVSNVVGELPTIPKKKKVSRSPEKTDNLPIMDSTPMIPNPVQPSDISFEPETTQYSSNDAYDYTKLIEVPPFKRITAPVETVDPTIPGTVKTDPSGKLQKTFFVYDGLAADTINTYNHFIQERIPNILGSRSIKINDGTDANGKALYRVISFVNSIMAPPGIRSKDDFNKIYPLTAQNTNSDYVGELWANGYVRNQDGVNIGEPVTVFLGSLPVMIRSVLCNTVELSDYELIRIGFDPKDPGGYFIMNGLEKVVLIQEKLRVNQIATYATDNAGHLVTKMTCATVRGTSVVTLSYDEKTGVIKYKYGGSDPKVDVINALLPFRLLGELVNGGKPLSLDDIWNFIVPFIDPKDLRKVLRKLQGTFADLATIRDTKAAVSFLADHRAMKTDTKWQKLKAQVEKEGSALEDEINDIKDEDAHEAHITATLIGPSSKKVVGGDKRTKKQLENAKMPKLDYKTKKDILQKDMLKVLFPQLDKDVNGTSKKLYMLGMMIAHFGQVLAGVRKPDDRDDWGNKQLKSPGLMMEQLFTSIWNSMINKLQDSANQQTSSSNVTNLIKNIDSALMTRTFYKSFTSTKWGLRRTDNANITDILKRASLAELASYITKISTPADKNVKKPEIRMVQGSQLGYVCPIDTPEGGSCLTMDTQILTDDGYTSVPIGNIEDGRTGVMSFNINNNTFTPGSTDKYFAFEAKDRNRKLYKITTLSGRSIKATEDHPFWTNNNNWKNVSDLKIGDLLSVRHHTLNLSSETTENVILDKTRIIQKLESVGFSEILITKFINNLTAINLLPLKQNNKKLPVISRIAGYLIANGDLAVYKRSSNDNMEPSCSIKFGLLRDAEDFENDVSVLGINKVKISPCQTSVEDKNTGRISFHNTWLVQHSDMLGLLLISLGFTHGRKIDTDMLPVPDWIMKGSQLVKREFVSGFQGGDGSKILLSKRQNRKNAYSFKLNRTVQDRSSECNESTLIFMKQISEICSELGVEVLNVSYVKNSGNQNGISLSFANSEDNLIKYMEVIGYRYCFTKNNAGNKIYEYLKYKSEQIIKRIELKNIVCKYKDEGTKPIEISKLTGLSVRQITSLQEQRYSNKTLAPRDLMSIDEFYQKYEPVGDTLCVPIAEIVEIPSEIVADFSVPNGNESFVANGIVVHNCGLVKHKSITCSISIEHGEGLVRQELVNGNKISLRKTAEYDTICLLNSIILGWCNGSDTASYLVKKRRNLSIFSDICIYHNSRFHELLIFTNAGRPTRPLLVVDNSDIDNPILVVEKENLWEKPYEELLSSGAVEYLDALEQNQDNIVIAMSLDDFRDSHQKVIDARASFAEVESFKAMVDSTSSTQDILETQFGKSLTEISEVNLDSIEEIRKYADNEVKLARAVLNNLIIQSRYTHCELDPTALMGISASLIPLSNHNQGPRNIYQSSMGKQALGLINGAISHRMDNMKALAFPTRPYFATQSSKWLGMDEVPAAQTVTVAFMSYTGYNQEDAILINEAALQRGAFRYTVYHNYKASNKTSNDSKELFERPTPGRGESAELYSALNENGIPQVGRKVQEDYYIIGRVRRTPLKDGTDKVDNISTPLPVGINGVVDRVLISVQNGVQTIKVRIRQTRIPVRGDKFASRHAQKSTVGLVVPEEDMPRTLDGRRPTIIINPLCIPSRMTLAMVLELLGSKAAVMLGERINATAFRNFTQKSNILQELQRTLQEYGFNKLGNETMVSGITGEKFTTPIFVGPVYYQLLKHLVQFKYHARGGTGAVSILTRQPVPGRNRGGGLRTGEMERDSLIGHGASALLKGKLCDQSDPFIAVYCKQCGIPARHTPQKPAKCSNCKSDDYVGTATTPYSYQLLAHLVRGVGFRPRLSMVPKKSPDDISITYNSDNK